MADPTIPAPVPAPDIELRPWTPDDLWLLERQSGDPAMTVHLGGPESPEQIRRRLARYVEIRGDAGAMFVIVLVPGREAVGSIGYWAETWEGEPIWETGWAVLTEHQGRGIAAEAARRCARLAAGTGKRRWLHAFPSVANAASNAVCRKAGFTLRGEVEVEYPKGHPTRSFDWVIDLDLLRLASRG